MTNTNPFYQFEPATLNGGFEPELSFQNDVLDLFYALFTDGDFVGQTIGETTASIRQSLATLNNAINGGNLFLKLPSPYPALVGVQSFVMNIYNKQTFAKTATNVVTFTIGLSGTDVTSFVKSISSGPSYYIDNQIQLLDVERMVSRALIVREQNGSSFLPETFKYIDGIAETGLIRARDWEFNEYFGFPLRTPFDDRPYMPSLWFDIGLQSPEQKYCISLLDHIVGITLESIDVLSLSDVIDICESQAIKLPENWTYALIDNSSDTIELRFISDSDLAFSCVAQKQGYKWFFQRFISLTGITTENFIDDYVGAIPFEPTSGRLYFSKWYDLEFCRFQSEMNDCYCQPIKSGDLYQFNILQSQANAFGLTDFKIGLFDVDKNFKAEIGSGSIELPTITLTIPAESFSVFLAKIVFGSLTTIFDLFNCGGEQVTDVPLLYSGSYTANISDYASAVCDLFNSIDGFTASYLLDGDMTITIIPDLNVDVSSITINGEYLGEYWTYTSAGIIQTQYQANVLIPYLPKGNYFFGLYISDDYALDILAFSNCLSLNNAETFSTILEYWGKTDSITEGFEYFGEWKQRIRVGLNGAGQTAKIEESIYRNSNGTFQRPMNESDLMINLQTDYLDLTTQKAMFSATRHTNFVWSNQNLSVQGDLDITTTQDFTTETTFRKLSQVRFSALYQGYQPENNACIGC